MPPQTHADLSALETRIASAILAEVLRIQRKIENAFADLFGKFSARRDIAISVAGHEYIDRHCDLEYHGSATRDRKLIVGGISSLNR